MKKNIKVIYGIILVSIFLSGCGSSATKEEYEEHNEHEEEEGIVSLTQQQIDAIELKLVQIEQRNMTVGIQAAGKLELAPQDKADVSPVLGGIVKSVKVFEGDKVRKGQILAVLEHPDFIQIQQDYIINLNNQKYLEKEYIRQKKLYEAKVGSGREFQKISADYQISKSTSIALKAKLKLLGLNTSEISKGKIYTSVNIVSPMNGAISLVETNVGAYIEPLSKVFEIVNNAKIHADLMVYERDMSNVDIGQKIIFSTSSQPGKEFEAEIYALSPVFEDNPKSIHVHAKILTKHTKLLPGMYIQGKVIADNIETSVLPSHAVITENEKSYIFVKTKGEDHNKGHDDIGQEDKEESKHEEHEGEHEEERWSFKMTEVITGVTSGDFVEVKLLTPLPENVEIAGSGAYYLLAEMGKGETEHSH